MKAIIPAPVTDAMLVSSVPEADHPVWSATTNYAVGDRVIRLQTHTRYECLIAGANASSPESSPTRWLKIGPTNRWAAFDNAVGTATTATGSLTVQLTPGQRVDALALLDVEATSVRVTMQVGTTNIYTYEEVLSQTVEPVTDYYSYWQALFKTKTVLVLQDLPRTFAGAMTTVELFSASGGTVKVGTIVLGSAFDVGSTQYGLSGGITDYSVVTEDAFGTTTVVERGYAKRFSSPVLTPRERHDAVFEALASLRATPVVWVGLENGPASTVVYGFARDWSGQINYANWTLYNLEIRGLT